MTPTDPTTMLREAQLRATRPRVAVLDLLERHPHADADTIARAAREILGKVSTQAVYDVLGALTEARLVRRIEPAGSRPLRAAGRRQPPPPRLPHLRRDRRRRLRRRRAPCLHASDDHGYDIDEAEVIYWGTCPACKVDHPTGATQPAD